MLFMEFKFPNYVVYDVWQFMWSMWCCFAVLLFAIYNVLQFMWSMWCPFTGFSHTCGKISKTVWY